MNLEDIKFDKNGLIPCVVQDFKDNAVLMVAYMNKQSLEKTIKEKKACYYSRSRRKLWLKGEQSGNIQFVKEIYIDCDNDTILLKVEQKGGCACHKGYRSCFFRKFDSGIWKNVGEKIREPGEMYGKE
ncbi:MAG: phosphoribosyl-AMP cyclohydrolase [Elusimicrobiota bacterium]